MRLSPLILPLLLTNPLPGASQPSATTKLTYQDGINIAPFSSGQSATDLHLVDLTDSGTLDVVFTTSIGEVVVAENLGGGLFSSPEELYDFNGSVRRVGVMDFDGNGSKDLILCVNPALFAGGLKNLFYVSDPMDAELRNTVDILNTTDTENSDFVNEPNECDDLRLADMNNDGILDIIVTMDNWKDDSGTLAILYCDGVGGADLQIISDILLLGYSTLEISDLDGDGHNDIAVLAQDRDALFVFFYNENAETKYEVEVVDLQLDGVRGAMAIGQLRTGSTLPDIITVSNKGLNIYQNDGDRKFSKDAIFEDGFLPVGSALRSAVYDLDGNGLADILVTDIRVDFSDMGLHVFSQEEPFKFSSPVEVKEKDATAFTFADVDDDGVNDLVISDNLKGGVYAYLGQVQEVTASPTRMPVTPAPTLKPVTPVPTSAAPSDPPTKPLIPNLWMETETVNATMYLIKAVLKDDILAVLGESTVNGTRKTELHIYERKSFGSWHLWKKEANFEYGYFQNRNYQDGAPLAISNGKVLAMNSIYSQGDGEEWAQEINFPGGSPISGFSVCFDDGTAVVVQRDGLLIYHWEDESNTWELKFTDTGGNLTPKKGQCHSMGQNKFIVEWYWSSYVFSIDKETWNVTKEEPVSPGNYNPTYFMYKDKMIYGGGSRDDSRPGAWIYSREDEQWVMEADLKIPVSLSDAAKKSFGHFVSMTDNRAVVSTLTSKACVYVQEEKGNWVLEAFISFDDDSVIRSVSIDNETVVVTRVRNIDPFDRQVHIFQYYPPTPSGSPSLQPSGNPSGMPSLMPSAKESSSEVSILPTKLPSVTKPAPPVALSSSITAPPSAQDTTLISPTEASLVEPACGLNSDPKQCGCSEIEQQDYRGTISVTEDGIDCMLWSDQDPHSHSYNPDEYPMLESNYCRNPPGSGVSRVWCYTSDPDNRWQYCSIPVCADRNGESEPEERASPVVSATTLSRRPFNFPVFVGAIVLCAIVVG